MAIEISGKTITIGIRDLVMLDDNFRGYSEIGAVGFNRAELGRLAHEKYQAHREGVVNFKREIFIKHQLEINGYTVILKGRIDGISQNEKIAVVEEIKSVFMTRAEFRNIDIDNFKDYCNQLKVYCYLIKAQNSELEVQGSLVFINLIDSTIRRLKVPLDLQDINNFITAKLREVIAYIEHQAERTRLKQGWAGAVQFPFAHKRRYQSEIIELIFNAVAQPKNILLHAPTGIGKTSAALFPILKAGFYDGNKIFFLTAKSPQQKLVLTTLRKIKSPKIPLIAVALRAKRKMCLNECFMCHEDFCPYITDFHKKLQKTNTIEKLLQTNIIDPDEILETGKKIEVCPFELSLELIFYADVVVCDYNYIFDPVVALQRFFVMNDRKKCTLIIDEAHNLYDRGRSYYSQELKRSEVEALVRYLARKRAQVYRLLFKFFQRLLIDLKAIPKKLDNGKVTSEITLNREYFEAMKSELQRLMLKYYIFKKQRGLVIQDDPLEDFYFKFNRFNIALSLDGEEFANIYEVEGDDYKLRVICMDPANQLSETIKRFGFVIGMSGTLEPLEWYQDVLGFGPSKTVLARFGSPFPPENRCILAVPTVSTKYRDRESNYQRIAEHIHEITSCRRGNYIVFFPSFKFIEQVRKLLPATNYKIVSQRRTMLEYEREYVLELLRSGRAHHLVLAVQGGIFAEGVDYPGEMVIGVIVVGPGLPQVGLERELMKQYYTQKYGMGFEYAYLYPGMVRVIQSAGRLIRSENDKGIIVLLGTRFAYRQYNSLFPQHWFVETPQELVSNDFYRLKEFWAGLDMHQAQAEI
ncbi:MAG: DEAD/DEAH box helicase [Thermoplasmata archaeon]|nr:DEAD/DEAH box helicase [Thermoplasmata archaeon]